MKLILEAIEGPRKGRVYQFDRHATFVAGRSRYAHFSAPEDTVMSRDHFLIEINPPRCELRDLNSTNGTFVNGRKVTQVRLRDGDRIVAGSNAFLARIEGVSSSSITMPTDDHLNLNLNLNLNLSPNPSPSAAAVATAIARMGTIRCGVCGTQAPDGLDVAREPDCGDSSESIVWLCTRCRAQASASPQLALDYTIIRELGRGAMGVVFLASHNETGQNVALKLIVPEIAAARSAVERFTREIEALRQLQHANIVQLLDHGLSQGRIWFAMEYVDGMSLEALAKSRPGSYPIARACRMAAQVLRGLEHAHAIGIVHRDVKPENILIGRAPNGARMAKLSDFGLAKCYRNIGLAELTFSGELRGTIPFMPPEQIIDFRTVLPVGDLYSAAASLYHLITGDYLYEISVANGADGGGDLLRKMLSEDPIPIRDRRTDVPQGLADVIAKCLARDPQQRFPNARAMRKALKPFCEED